MRIYKTINGLADAAFKNAKKKGFHNEPIKTWWPKMLLNLIGEVSEVWEAERNGTLNSPCDKSERMKALGLPILTCLEEEYADKLIRILDQSRRLDIDIVRAASIKHAYNTTRPYKHGKKH